MNTLRTLWIGNSPSALFLYLCAINFPSFVYFAIHNTVYQFLIKGRIH